MNEAEVIDLVAEVAREKLGWSGELRPEMRLIEDLELDSIRLLELAVELENRLRIRLDEEEESAIETVGDLARLVGSKLDDAG